VTQLRPALLFLSFMIGSCGVASAAQFVGSDASSAVYVAWTADSSGHLQGQIQCVSLSAGGAQAKTTSAAFTGTQSGKDISLAFGLLSAFGGATWTGHLGWNTLTLDYSTSSGPAEMALRRGSFADFQRLVTALQGSASRVAAAQALAATRAATTQALARSVTEAANQINIVNRELQSALSALSKEFPEPPPDVNTAGSFQYRYDRAYSKMNDDWSKEQTLGQRVPLTCYQKSQVAYVASTVSYDLSQIQYIDSNFRSFVSDVQGQIETISRGQEQLKALLPAYAARWKAWQQSANPANPKPVPLDVSSVLSETLRRTNAAQKHAMARLARAVQIAATYDNQATELEQKAKSYPDGLTCSN